MTRRYGRSADTLAIICMEPGEWTITTLAEDLGLTPNVIGKRVQSLRAQGMVKRARLLAPTRHGMRVHGTGDLSKSIARVLSAVESGATTVKEVSTRLGVSIPRAHSGLQLLVQYGRVKVDRSGREHVYSISAAPEVTDANNA